MKYRGLVLYPRAVLRHNDGVFDWLRCEAAKFGMALDIRFFEDAWFDYGSDYTLCFGGQRQERPDFVVVRGYAGLLSRHFELQGIPVVNTSESMELSNNKMSTHQLLSCRGIPTPRTVFTGAGYRYEALCDLFGAGTFVVKQTDGAKGEHVFLVDSTDSLADAVRSCRGDCICQEFIETSFGKDLRVWVVGGEAVAQILRFSEYSFKSNFSQGGKAALCTISEEVERLAVNSVQALGLEFAGVDILFGKDGAYTVCEVNGNAGFRSLSNVSDNCIPYRLFQYIDDRYLRHL